MRMATTELIGYSPRFGYSPLLRESFLRGECRRSFMSGQPPEVTLLGPRWFCRNQCNSFGKYGGDDETRTRDLCRDRAVTTSTYNNLQGYQGLPSTCKHVVT